MVVGSESENQRRKRPREAAAASVVRIWEFEGLKVAGDMEEEAATVQKYEAKL